MIHSIKVNSIQPIPGEGEKGDLMMMIVDVSNAGCCCCWYYVGTQDTAID